MSEEKNILNKFNLLYVEDDEDFRIELSGLLSKFFLNVYTAKDLQDALQSYEKNRIDIILTNINIPTLNGIDLVKNIREKNKAIPIILTTSQTDMNSFIQAIKLRVQDFFIKPINTKDLIFSMSELAKKIYNHLLLEKQRIELERYKEITDLTNIVIKTDANMKINYVNQLFCDISGFSKDELLGKDFKFLKDEESSDEVYEKLYEDVLNNTVWKGYLKNRKKSAETYTTDCYMITILNDSQEFAGTISIQKDVTEDLNKKREIQLALMKEKSDSFIKNKEGSIEQNLIINDLKQQLEQTQINLEKALKNLDNYIFLVEKYKIENKNLNTELGLYKRKNSVNSTFKMSKENQELKDEIKKLLDEREYILNLHDNEIQNLHEEYKKENNQLKEKLENLTNDSNSSNIEDDILEEKIKFWKEKANNEALKLEKLEKKIIEYADANLMSKIFE